MGLKEAASPEELITAPEIKLLSGGKYPQFAADLDESSDAWKPVVTGSPHITLDTRFSALNGCEFSEPSFLSRASGLYLALLCVKPDSGTQSIELLKWTRAGAITDGASWEYKGTLLTKKDAQDLGFEVGFSAPNLFQDVGGVYLLVSPVSNQPQASSYNGTFLMKVDDLEVAGIGRDPSTLKPAILNSILGPENSFNGAATYLPEAPAAGVLYLHAEIGSKVRFNTYLTGISPFPRYD